MFAVLVVNNNKMLLLELSRNEGLIQFLKTYVLGVILSEEFELQEVGCNHAQSVGFSTDGFATTTTMRKLHLIWVTARMHIEIYKYPAW